MLVKLDREQLARLHQRMMSDPTRLKIVGYMERMISKAPVVMIDGKVQPTKETQSKIDAYKKLHDDYCKQSYPELFQTE